MTKLQKKMAGLESTRLKLNTLLATYSDTELNKTPPSGGWSPAEVLKHIVDVEQATLSYCEYKLQKGEPLRKSGLREKRNALLLKLALLAPLKFHAPSALPTVQGPYNTVQLLHEWELLRKKYQLFTDSFPAVSAKSGIFRHPRAGMLSMSDTLAFLQAHLSRHVRQLKRSLR